MLLVFVAILIDIGYGLPGPDNEFECNVRLLAYEYALNIQSYRGSTQPLTYDALQINQYCNQTNNEKYYKYKSELKYGINDKKIGWNDEYTGINDINVTVYVDPINGNDNNNGSIDAPYVSLAKALNETRSYKDNDLLKVIYIREGTVYLMDTIVLSPLTYDNNLIIQGYPNENAEISGGILLPMNHMKWEVYDPELNVYMTNLSDIIDTNILYNNTILSLFTDKGIRLTRARYPNGDLSVFYKASSFIPATNTITWWVQQGDIPKQIFKNLSCAIPDNVPCLNYSTQWQYNLYTSGYGGVCDIWDTDNFWCGEYVSGGWAFEDANMYKQGIRQLPIGMTYNITNDVGKRISSWKSNINEEGIVFVKHDQGWCMTMNKIGDYNLKIGNISFSNGGFQGANVNRLSDANAINNKPIETGPYYFDGIFDELDVVNEWYYNKTSKILYFIPNMTINNTGDLIIANLDKIFHFKGDNIKNPLTNVVISNLIIKHTRYNFLEPWGVPSGGGWALNNNAALYYENTTNMTVSDSYFYNIDGNAIMLYGYNRNNTFIRNEFTSIGCNVMGGWGITNDYDGTNLLQPRFTNIIENYVHEIGLYQLQSSAWFQAKTCQTTVKNNIVFNVPRAAINLNDGFGGANDIFNNLLFNTCSESGDHGPINSWDRMPFMHNLNGTNTYHTLYSNVHNNFIFANYGGSQGFDTDDGSAWYNIYNNVMYNALGYKNDYGGYNVNYHDNINILFGGKVSTQSCWGMQGTFYNGPSNRVYNNKCIVYSTDGITSQIWYPASKKGSALYLYNNSYYTIYNNVTLKMQNESYDWNYYNITEMQNILNKEYSSSSNPIPSNDEMLQWIQSLLGL